MRPIAEPGVIVATELAFARFAREDGRPAAFKEFAADDAVMFTPQPVAAKEWLKNNQLPADLVDWQVHKVWLSCDGSLALSRGAWRHENGTSGSFVNLWMRQEDGGYKWVFSDRQDAKVSFEEPEFIQSDVANCDREGFPPPAISSTGTSTRHGQSADGTFYWVADVAADQTRSVNAYSWNGAQFVHVMDWTVSP